MTDEYQHQNFWVTKKGLSGDYNIHQRIFDWPVVPKEIPSIKNVPFAIQRGPNRVKEEKLSCASCEFFKVETATTHRKNPMRNYYCSHWEADAIRCNNCKEVVLPGFRQNIQGKQISFMSDREPCTPSWCPYLQTKK